MSTVKIPEYIIAREVYEEAGIGFADFTDEEDATGTYTCGFTLPVGYFIERCWLTDVTGFAGDTTATIIVGDGSDTDRLNTGTPSVFTTATAIDLGAVSGTQLVATAFKPVLTIEEDSNWGDVAAGELTIKVMGFMV
jgi:hypothetical protein